MKITVAKKELASANMPPYMEGPKQASITVRHGEEKYWSLQLCA